MSPIDPIERAQLMAAARRQDRDATRAALLKRVKPEKVYRVTDIVSSVASSTGVDEDTIRRTVWGMVNRQELLLGDNLTLTR